MPKFCTSSLHKGKLRGDGKIVSFLVSDFFPTCSAGSDPLGQTVEVSNRWLDREPQIITCNLQHEPMRIPNHGCFLATSKQLSEVLRCMEEYLRYYYLRSSDSVGWLITGDFYYCSSIVSSAIMKDDWAKS
jgi:hypothetical protein